MSVLLNNVVYIYYVHLCEPVIDLSLVNRHRLLLSLSISKQAWNHYIRQYKGDDFPIHIYTYKINEIAPSHNNIFIDKVNNRILQFKLSWEYNDSVDSLNYKLMTKKLFEFKYRYWRYLL